MLFSTPVQIKEDILHLRKSGRLLTGHRYFSVRIFHMRMYGSDHDIITNDLNRFIEVLRELDDRWYWTLGVLAKVPCFYIYSGYGIPRAVVDGDGTADPCWYETISENAAKTARSR